MVLEGKAVNPGGDVPCMSPGSGAEATSGGAGGALTPAENSGVRSRRGGGGTGFFTFKGSTPAGALLR